MADEYEPECPKLTFLVEADELFECLHKIVNDRDGTTDDLEALDVKQMRSEMHIVLHIVSTLWL